MMVHLQNTFVTDGAVVAAVWFYQLASVTVSDCSRHGPGVDGKVLGCSPENFLMGFSPRLSLQQLFLCVREVEFF